MSWRIHAVAAMIGTAVAAVRDGLAMRVLLVEDEPSAAHMLAKGLVATKRVSTGACAAG